MAENTSPIKGFIKNLDGNTLLPITRAELVLDSTGQVALHSTQFLADTTVGGKPGLITAAERAMLSGGGGGQNITDLYNKIGYINTGLKFGNSILNYYKTEDGTTTATPITINAATNQLSLGIANNVVTFGLHKLHTNGLSASTIVKSIVVDDYGRVTSVSGSALTNAEIPAELNGKTIQNSTLTGCTTSAVAENDGAIVNKKYVDDKFSTVNTIATGALRFGGTITGSDLASRAKVENLHKYYKVVEDITVTDTVKQYLYTDGVIPNIIRIGDTLIIQEQGSKYVYVHVPSGDEITTVTVQHQTASGGSYSSTMDRYLGNATLQFAYPFITSVQQGTPSIVNIALSAVSNTKDGYLTAADYKTFKEYATNLKVSYAGNINENTVGSYTIGTLTIGNSDSIIRGINNISSLSLVNGTGETTTLNPRLKFTETGGTGVVDTHITLEGTNGVQISKDGNSVKIKSTSSVKEGSTGYLKITNNSIFEIVTGKDGGLVDYTANEAKLTTMDNKINTVATAAVYFMSISNSLSNSTGDYIYGSEKLIEAISVTI